jgi:hypothetical protein
LVRDLGECGVGVRSLADPIAIDTGWPLVTAVSEWTPGSGDRAGEEGPADPAGDGHRGLGSSGRPIVCGAPVS